MPRKDRTFSDNDIVRLTIHNLTRKEKLAVLETLCGITQEVPVPTTPPIQKKKDESVKIEVEIAIETIDRLSRLLDTAEKFPGPQQSLLLTINRGLGIIKVVLGVIGRIVE